MRYLLRFSEIGTKAPHTRRSFLRILEENIRAAFLEEHIRAHVSISAGLRGFVESGDIRVPEVLSRIFGIRSFSPVHEGDARDLRTFVGAGEEFFREQVRGKRFSVRARRIGVHEFTSHDIETMLGERLTSYGTVDLTNPEYTAAVEVRGNEGYFFSDRKAGPGGLPLGTQGRALALVSGGFDSAVAAWLLMKRGVPCDYCFFNLGGPIHEEGTLRVVKILSDRWQYGDNPKVVIVPFQDAVRHIRQRVKESYWNLVLKRAMLSVAAEIARFHNADALVVGDAIGQVASQTLKNLRALGGGSVPILRPLLSFDKDEIVNLAKTVGTAPLSAAVKEYCALVPSRPVTEATPEALEREWKKVDAAALHAAFGQQRMLNLRRLVFSDHGALEEVATKKVPKGARMIDVRESGAYEQWHPKSAEHIPASEALMQIGSFDASQPILFYCAYGLVSAELAQHARQQGLSAWSFAGGADALRFLLERSGQEAARVRKLR